MQKKSLTFLLLIILLLPILGSYISFNLRQIANKKELKRKIKRGLPDSELISMVLTPEILNSKSFEWHNSHEFRLNGRMYDIIKTYKKGNQTEYKVVWDNEESELFSQLESDLKEAFSHDPVQKSNSAKFLSFLKSIYIQQIEDDRMINIDFNLLQKHQIKQKKRFVNAFLKNTSPPPEFFIIS
jgi:hypothetical protein